MAKAKVNKVAEVETPTEKFGWHQIDDDLMRDLALIGRMALTNEDVLNLPLPDDNGMLWPMGTLLLDDDGKMYEWREQA